MDVDMPMCKDSINSMHLSFLHKEGSYCCYQNKRKHNMPYDWRGLDSIGNIKEFILMLQYPCVTEGTTKKEQYLNV